MACVQHFSCEWIDTYNSADHGVSQLNARAFLGFLPLLVYKNVTANLQVIGKMLPTSCPLNDCLRRELCFCYMC